MKTSVIFKSASLKKTLFLAALLATTSPYSATAQVIFAGVEYSSMCDAFSATLSSVDQDWITPERRQELENTLEEITAKMVDGLAQKGVEKSFGSLLGGSAYEVIVDEKIELLAKRAIQHARSQPIDCEQVSHLVAQVGFSIPGINSILPSDNEPAELLGQDTTFLQKIQGQLTLNPTPDNLRAASDILPSNENWKLEEGIRNLWHLAQQPVPSATGDVEGSCLTNESDLFKYFLHKSEGSTAYANTSVIGVINASTTEYLGQNNSSGLYQYRVRDIELCEALEKQTNRAQSDLDRMVQLRVSEAIDYACMGAGGEMSEASTYVKDLDGDGAQDLILDHGGVKCTNGRNISCGAQVCTTEFFLQRDGTLAKEVEILGTITDLSNDPIPLISIWGHGGNQGEIRWNGRAFQPF
ncbi:hypothetical protein [Rhodovulum sp. FJ3]|uniref:hypothetical protein n=1 Tax=Rhodovulum sp. FJ3 TaxID=3079053 RepID=UPI00293DE4BF|nr:hypothetical protein [Rhodovulum sp. FJ3]MDV4169280.1 hypothetical protein [Rhodovulum sp. FJ3]